MRPAKTLLYRIVCEHVSKFHFKLVIKGEAPGRAGSKVPSWWRHRAEIKKGGLVITPRLDTQKRFLLRG